MLPTRPQLVDLRALGGSALDSLLAAQAEQWRRRFGWDRQPAHEAIRRLLGRGALHGRALAAGGALSGYSFFVPDGRTAIVGDFFLAAGSASSGNARRLLEGVLAACLLHPGVDRVEGQILCLRQLPELQRLQGGTLREFARRFMVKPALDRAPARPRVPATARFGPWSDPLLRQAAELVAEAYEGHVDAAIASQYGSVRGALRYLEATTGHGASGPFLAEAAVVARQAGGERLLGACLPTMACDRVAHIAQLCVAPPAQGQGVGSGMLELCLARCRRAGCRAASLAVTRSNARAVRLYERHGFESVAEFPALVWRRRRPRARIWRVRLE